MQLKFFFQGLTSAVNFINILRTNFLYQCRFDSFFYVHVTREKMPKQLSYQKRMHITLMKLTPEDLFFFPRLILHLSLSLLNFEFQTIFFLFFFISFPLLSTSLSLCFSPAKVFSLLFLFLGSI